MSLKSESSRNKLREDLLRRSLFVEMLDRRHEEITSALEGTFEWIFSQFRANERSWHSFIRWLEKDASPYWISGKAGSGKSTLLKFICNDDRTLESLRIWSRPQGCIIAKTFFWNTGSYLQKSSEGMLRSLLYQLLSGCNELVRIAVPPTEAIWQTASSEAELVRDYWTEARLCQAFRRLTSCHHLPVKIACFIDGLDEFDGDHEMLVQLIKDVPVDTGVKICVSSRPWPLFHDNFSEGPLLHLHDLTRGDIEALVLTRLSSHERGAYLMESNKIQATSFITYILVKAEGVFIWVVLVLQSLLNGLRNHDDWPELMQRLQALPLNIEKLYESMLARQEPIYYEQACRYFRIMTAAKDPLSLTTMAFAIQPQPEFLHRWSVEKTNVESSMMLWPTEVKLKSRCMGLLELKGKTVRFLHQSVRNFLDEDRIVASMATASTKSSNFSPHRAILCAYIAQLNCFNDADGLIEKQIARTRTYFEYVDTITHESVWDLLEDFESRLMVLSKANAAGDERRLLVQAVRMGLVHTVKFKLQQKPELLDDYSDEPLLHETLT